MGDGISGTNPRSNESNNSNFKVGTSPRSPLISSAQVNIQITDITENAELKESRFSQWNPLNCFVLSCLKRYEQSCLNIDRFSVPY